MGFLRAKLSVMAVGILLGCGTLVQAEEANGSLQLPWEKFEQLLRLGDDTIGLTMPEYELLLKQAGISGVQGQLGENGKVFIPRQTFRQWLERARDSNMSFQPYRNSSAAYQIRVGNNGSRVTARLMLQIPPSSPIARFASVGGLRGASPIAPALVAVPVFPSSLALSRVLLDGRPAVLDSADGWTRVLASVGSHVVEAEFPVANGSSTEPGRLLFPVAATPITTVTVRHPRKDAEITIPGAPVLTTQELPTGVSVSGALPLSSQVEIVWNPKAPAMAKGPAKVYANVLEFLSVDEGVVRAQSNIQLNVLQNSVRQVLVSIPPSWNVLEVEGERVGEWKLEKNGAQIVVPFTVAQSGDIRFAVKLEQTLTEKNAVVAFEGVHVAGAIREKGFMGVEVKNLSETKIPDLVGLTRVDVQELPAELQNLAERPLLFGFRRNAPVQRLVMDIEKHEDVAVMSTVIDNLNAVTFAFKDGLLVHQMAFQVRNNWKQFLDLPFAKDAQVWTVFVEGAPVKPMKRDDGHLLIPLNRSSTENGPAEAFRVEIMFATPRAPLSPIGRDALELPMPDVLVSQAFWSLYFPDEQNAVGFGGNVDKERAVQGVQPLMSAVFAGQRRYGVRLGKLGSAAKRKDSDAKEMFDRVSADAANEQLMFESKAVGSIQNAKAPATTDLGVLPVRVNVPASGKVYRFYKEMITTSTPLTLSVWHLHQDVIRAILAVLLTVVGFVLYRKRKTLQHALDRVVQRMSSMSITTARFTTPRALVVWGIGLITLGFLFQNRLSYLGAVVAAVGIGRLYWLKQATQNTNRPL